MITFVTIQIDHLLTDIILTTYNVSYVFLLQEFNEKNGPCSEKVALDLLHDLLLSLKEMHSVGLVHRDIKPDNFMICQNNTTGMTQLKLIDVGLATRFTSDSGVYEVNVGTEYYMSPEALRGWHLPASDLFSAGLSIFMLMGSPQCVNQDSSISESLHELLLKFSSDEHTDRGSICDAIRSVENMKNIPKALRETVLLDNEVIFLEEPRSSVKNTDSWIQNDFGIDITMVDIPVAHSESNNIVEPEDSYIEESKSSKKMFSFFRPGIATSVSKNDDPFGNSFDPFLAKSSQFKESISPDFNFFKSFSPRQKRNKHVENDRFDMNMSIRRFLSYIIKPTI